MLENLHMEDTIQKVCFTGKRSASMPWKDNESDPRCKALKERLEQEILLAVQDGYRYFITGMAQGADTWAGEIVLRLRETQYPDLRLEAAVPYLAQPKAWPEQDQTRYYNLLFDCNKRTLCSPAYHRGCFHVRNRYMVDAAQRVIAVYDGSGGGTGYTVSYAQSKGRDVRIVSF